jgi:hypothetical protein
MDRSYFKVDNGAPKAVARMRIVNAAFLLLLGVIVKNLKHAFAAGYDLLTDTAIEERPDHHEFQGKHTDCASPFRAA